CEGSDIALTSTSILPSGSGTFNWDYSHGTSGTGATSAKQYPAPGIYNVTLTVTDANGCQASVSKYVTQAPRAIPDFTFTPTQCDNRGVSFTNTSTPPAFGATGYIWDFNDGTKSAAFSASHDFNQFKTYDVKLLVKTEFGCTDSIMKTVSLRESPKVSFTHGALVCGNRPVDFTNNTTVPAATSNTYAWDFGDGFTSGTDNPTHNFPAPGSYTVVLTATNSNGCEGEAEMAVTVLDNPNADFEATEVCEGIATQFTNNSYSSTGQTLAYNWDLGNTISSGARDTSYTYGTDGSYNVQLIVTVPGGCSDTMIKSVVVHPVPVVNILMASRLSRDGAFDFTADNIPNASYFWWFNGEGTSRSKDTSVKFMMDGRKVIKLLVTSDKGCISSDQDTLFVNRLGIKDAAGVTGKIAVYPNPSSGNFTIDLASVSEGEINGMSVTDVLGRTIISNVAVIPGSVSAIDLSSVSAGIYYLNVTTANGVNSIKLNVVK
ncbi:MAG TPA: PKD domain-containing protein, partial [Bacteroidia bacterium]|nr:PKD domain-containing protein [Bacteroidia bacterium]